MKFLAISSLLALVPASLAYVDFRLYAPLASGGQATSSATAQAFAAVGPSGSITTSTATAASTATTFRLLDDGTVRVVANGQASSQCIASTLTGPSGTLSATQCTASATATTSVQRFGIFRNHLVPLDGSCLYFDDNIFKTTRNCATLGAVAGARVQVVSGTVPSYGRRYFLAYDSGSSELSAQEFEGLSEDSANLGSLRVTQSSPSAAGTTAASVGLGVAALIGGLLL